jgi:hypothetical protein
MQDYAKRDRQSWIKRIRFRHIPTPATIVRVDPDEPSENYIMHIQRADGLPCIHVFADEPNQVKRR